MVSSRSSLKRVEESPGSPGAEMPGVFVPSAKVGSKNFLADGGEMMLSPT